MTIQTTKIFISIAGGALLKEQAVTWKKFIDIPKNRPIIISKIIEFIALHNFDGVDIDLEWRNVTKGYSPFIIELRKALPKNMMLTATLFAGLFLVAYVTRWYLYGSKAFEGTGAWRVFYIANLIPHIILAIAVGPLALYLIHLALYKRDFRTHRKFARITLPMWLYVASSGWLIYYLLYQMQF